MRGSVSHNWPFAMGQLMRRHWIPALLAEEVPEPDGDPVPLRLLGEDLVAFRDSDGRVGIMDRYCPHRRASLVFGRNEDCGLRCNYHGWLFDEQGACLQQPFEEMTNPGARFKDRVQVKSYRVEPLAGLLWAYLGPEPAPLLVILPKRGAGWNKHEAPAAIDDLSIFDDAEIVWVGDAAYSANPTTMALIAGEDGVSVLTEIAAGAEIWVKY